MRTLWAIFCTMPSLFPAYLLLIYKDPGAGNFGWQMFLGFALFWGSMLVALACCTTNVILLIKKPGVLGSGRIAICFLIVTVLPLLMGIRLLRLGS